MIYVIPFYITLRPYESLVTVIWVARESNSHLAGFPFISQTYNHIHDSFKPLL